MKYRINLEKKVPDGVHDVSFYTVLGFLAANGGEFEPEIASKTIGISKDVATMALGFWMGTGVIVPDTDNTYSASNALTPELVEGSVETPKKIHETLHEKREKSTANYSASELARKLDESKEMSSLIDFCNRTTEKMLNFAETADIVYLVDSVGLSTSMVMKIVDYFAGKGKRGIRYITKAAISIFDEGITDDFLLDEYLKKKNEYDTGEGFLRSLIGAGARSFSKREKAFVEKWFNELKLDKSIIKLAYERTVDKISTPSLSYMAKIIERWTDSGFKTADEVIAGESAQLVPQASSGNFNLSDFDEASVISSQSENSEMESFFDN